MGAACSGERDGDNSLLTSGRPNSLSEVVYGHPPGAEPTVRPTRKSIWSTMVLTNRHEIDALRRQRPQDNDDWEGFLNFHREELEAVKTDRGMCRGPIPEKELAEQNARRAAKMFPPGYETAHPDLWIDPDYDRDNGLGTRDALYTPPPEKHRELAQQRAKKKLAALMPKTKKSGSSDNTTKKHAESNAYEGAIEGQKRSSLTIDPQDAPSGAEEDEIEADDDWSEYGMGSPDDVAGLQDSEPASPFVSTQSTKHGSAASSSNFSSSPQSAQFGGSQPSISNTPSHSTTASGANSMVSNITSANTNPSTTTSALGALSSGGSKRANTNNRGTLPSAEDLVDSQGRPFSPRSRMRIMLACLNGMTQQQAFEYNATCKRSEEAHARARKAAFARQLGLSVEQLNKALSNEAEEEKQEDEKSNENQDESKDSSEDNTDTTSNSKPPEKPALTEEEVKAAAEEKKARIAERKAQLAEKKAKLQAEKEASSAAKAAEAEESRKKKRAAAQAAKLGRPAEQIEGVRLIDQHEFVWWEERLLQDPSQHKWKLHNVNEGVSRVFTAMLDESTMRNDHCRMRNVKIYRAELFIPDSTPLKCFRSMYDVAERMSWDTDYKENIVTKKFDGFPFHNDLWYCFYSSLASYDFMMVRAYSMYRDAGKWIKHRVAGTNVPDAEIDAVYTQPDLSVYDYCDPSAASKLSPDVAEELAKEPEALSYIYRSTEHSSKPKIKGVDRGISQGICMFVKTPLPADCGYTDHLSKGRSGTLFLTISTSDLDMSYFVRKIVESAGAGQFQGWCEKFLGVMKNQK